MSRNLSYVSIGNTPKGLPKKETHGRWEVSGMNHAMSSDNKVTGRFSYIHLDIVDENGKRIAIAGINREQFLNLLGRLRASFPSDPALYKENMT